MAYFVIMCIDKPGVEEKRKQAMKAHIEYLSSNPIKIVLSGPLMSDDGEHIVGSLFLVEADGRASVEKFQQGDPLLEADLWQSVEVRVFNKRVDNRD